MNIHQQKPGSAPILVKSDHFDVGLAPGLRGKHRLSSECISDSDTGAGQARSPTITPTTAGVTSDESAEATRMFATSPLDREGPSPFHRPRADSGGSVSSMERFRVRAPAPLTSTTIVVGGSLRWPWAPAGASFPGGGTKSGASVTTTSQT